MPLRKNGRLCKPSARALVKITKFCANAQKKFVQNYLLTFGANSSIIITESEGDKMIQKNREKEERKARRKPPIPYTRKTPTKKEKERKTERKYKNEYREA